MTIRHEVVIGAMTWNPAAGRRARRRVARRAAAGAKSAGATLHQERDGPHRHEGDARRTPTCCCRTARSPQIGKNLVGCRPARRSSTPPASTSCRASSIRTRTSMADAINEGSLSVTSMVRIRDVLNPTDINIYRAARRRRDDDQRAARIGEHDRRAERGREAASMAATSTR